MHLLCAHEKQSWLTGVRLTALSAKSIRGVTLMAAPTAEPPSAAGTNPRKQLPLSHLNAQSARVFNGEVLIWNPTDVSHTYLWGKKTRHSYGFQCLLVSTADPTQYILADSHGKGMTEAITKSLVAKFKTGLIFNMHNVVLAQNVKRRYNNAPKAEVACMRQTKFEPVLAVGAGKPVMPEPPVPIAACMGIDSEQHFDVLAMIQDISEAAPGGQLKDGRLRVRCTVTLIDGTIAKDEKKPRLMPVVVFADKPSNDSVPPLLQELIEAYEKKKAVAFFNIQGKMAEGKDESTWSFQSGFSFCFRIASSTTKGQHLESIADTLLATDANIVPKTVLQSRSMDNENFADQEATETTCGLLKTLLTNTNIAALEVDASFWQINWCRPYLPVELTQVCTADGTRLWFQMKLDDETGSITLFIREKAALALAAVDSKEAFEHAIATETLRFPVKASVKIIRKSPGIQTPTGKESSVGKPTQDGSGDDQPEAVRCYIVEAADQDLQYGPSKRSYDLMSLLSMTEPDTNACVPAALHMITKDPHYGLAVAYTTDAGEYTICKRCVKAIALVVATKPTLSDHVNGGYQMITDDVKDPFDSDFTCQLLSYCTVHASPDYQLKPNRGQKSQVAFVCIVDVLESTPGLPPVFLVEHMEKVDDCDAQSAPEHMSKRVEFACKAAQMQGKNASCHWTEAESPASAGKCKRLGKSPTDPID